MVFSKIDCIYFKKNHAEAFPHISSILFYKNKKMRRVYIRPMIIYEIRLFENIR